MRPGAECSPSDQRGLRAAQAPRQLSTADSTGNRSTTTAASTSSSPVDKHALGVARIEPPSDHCRQASFPNDPVVIPSRELVPNRSRRRTIGPEQVPGGHPSSDECIERPIFRPRGSGLFQLACSNIAPFLLLWFGSWFVTSGDY